MSCASAACWLCDFKQVASHLWTYFFICKIDRVECGNCCINVHNYHHSHYMLWQERRDEGHKAEWLVVGGQAVENLECQVEPTRTIKGQGQGSAMQKKSLRINTKMSVRQRSQAYSCLNLPLLLARAWHPEPNQGWSNCARQGWSDLLQTQDWPQGNSSPQQGTQPWKVALDSALLPRKSGGPQGSSILMIECQEPSSWWDLGLPPTTGQHIDTHIHQSNSLGQGLLCPPWSGK